MLGLHVVLSACRLSRISRGTHRAEQTHSLQVRLEHPTDMKSYRVLINGDASVVKAIKTLWQASSVYFINVPYDIPGVLYLTAANASFQSAMPVNITVQVPPKVKRNSSPGTWYSCACR